MAGPGPAWGAASPVDAPAEAPRRFPWTVLGVSVGLAVYLFYLWLWLVESEPVGAALLLGPILVALTIPLFAAAGRSCRDFDLGGLLLLGLVVRFGFSFQRFENAVDGYDYHVEGVRLASFYRVLDFGVSTERQVPGTGAMRAISGFVHVLVYDDQMASHLVLTWLAFLGCWFLYRAFSVAVGDGDRYRYARLLFLWPSMCFWPSSLGKDAWMLLTIGISAYGAARVYQRLAGGYTLLGLGLLGASFVRPHLALLTLVAFVIALLIGRRDDATHAVTPSSIAKVVGVILVIVVGSVLVSRTQELLAIEDFSASTLDSRSSVVSEQTNQGGSAFTPINPRTPSGFVEAAVTILVRPFPTEAHGFEQLFTSIEGLAIAALTVLSARRLASLPRRLRSQPYIAFALVFVLLWILAFGVIANFGILARQRTQMLPFYFVLLSVAPAVASRRTKRDARETRARP